MSDFIAWTSEESEVLPRAQKEAMYLTAPAAICFESRGIVCIKQLHTLLKMMLVEIELKCPCQVLHGVWWHSRGAEDLRMNPTAARVTAGEGDSAPESSQVRPSRRKIDVKGWSRWVDLLSSNKRPVQQKTEHWIYCWVHLETLIRTDSDMSVLTFWTMTICCIMFYQLIKGENSTVFNWSQPREQLHRRHYPVIQHTQYVLLETRCFIGHGCSRLHKIVRAVFLFRKGKRGSTYWEDSFFNTVFQILVRK